jgi:hypothetical protein
MRPLSEPSLRGIASRPGVAADAARGSRMIPRVTGRADFGIAEREQPVCEEQ